MNLGLQAGYLKRRFPSSEFSLHRDLLTWIGEITPSPMGAIYTVRLRYKLKNRPGVQILDPPLKRRDNLPIPHVFKGNKLCLFRFKYGEWNARRPLSETILPWTSLWLFYYEIWLITGVWHGGGEHPEAEDGKYPED